MQALAIPFKEELSPLMDGSSWDEYRRFSPSGLVPCLRDGELVVWESLAIIEYLAERHSGVWPQDIEARAWARCAAAEMHAGYSALRNECTMNCGVRVQLHSISSALQQNIRRLDELWNEGLKRFRGPFLAGDSFCAVDAFFAPIAFRIQTYNLAMNDNSTNYVQRLLNLDAMRDWYDAALQETWRAEGHEQEISTTGVVIKDLRVPVQNQRH
jgi:glutathione S-transferase